MGIEIIGEIRRFKSGSKMSLNTPIKTLTIYAADSTLIKEIEQLNNDIKGTMRIIDLSVLSGKPDIKERVTEIIPQMAKIGPEFKGEAPKIVEYLQSENRDELISKIENDGEIIIDGCKITPDHIEVKKEVVGKTGEKVEVIHAASIDVILEIIV